ncbi:LPS export ABC transporter permease LptF [Curvibacter sp. APW13]|uniref:LPS export ABC transporter permease LptF n=1 Tax=Curvibacter sp. APW13 TaxID=3077236 RepID=UPI0028DDCF3F|nr:LPS export ABC transporter permease LptF [Curvibacter sp. APW13]MDT8991353.1 LPS export ABC transporter permease LptF [Curvibacter sp. APW13]
MLFQSSVRKELARSFGATLVVLVTVVVTMTLIRTLGDASRGTFDPADVMVIMGYTVLSDLPTILTLSLFIAILSVLTRMYKDSEMVIWHASGRGLAALIKPLMRFSWPILVAIFALAILILPWAFGRIEDLRDRFEKRSDLARIEPGQFQESANGDRVFFIEKDKQDNPVGRNVFIVSREPDKEIITSAKSGQVQWLDGGKFLVLENGQRVEKHAQSQEVTISTFSRYSARIGTDDHSQRSYVPAASINTLDLLRNPTPLHLSELSWRVGVTLAAFNLVIVGLAMAGVNPRVGRSGNLGLAFLGFVVYLNMLLMGKNWIANGQIGFLQYMGLLHGGVFLAALGWLSLRHNAWSWRHLLR